MRFRRRTFALIAAAMALGVGLAACGGDDDDAAPAEQVEQVADDAAGEVQETVDEAAGEVEETVDEAAGDIADIVDTAVAAGDFETLVAAVGAAGLVETLKSPGPFTVFAPTDAAFAALPEGTVEDLLLPENQEDLAGVLTFHVVEGDVKAGDLSDGQVVPTVQGGELTIAISEDGVVTVNGATVTTADIETANGTIHVIDAVLLP